MRVKIRNKFWNLKFVKKLKGGTLAEIDPPNYKHKEIRVLSRLEGMERLDAIIHEVLHVSNFELFDEIWVDQFGTDLARILWRLGYRRKDEE